MYLETINDHKEKYEHRVSGRLLAGDFQFKMDNGNCILVG